MTIWFLVFIVLLWGIFFVPAGVRAKQRTPLPASQRFKRHLKSLAPARPRSGRWMVLPPTEERAAAVALERTRRRRRRIFSALLGAAAVSGVIAAWRRGEAIEIHLIVDALVFVYVAMLLESKRRHDEREAKVRPLRPTHEELRDRYLAAADDREATM